MTPGASPENTLGTDDLLSMWSTAIGLLQHWEKAMSDTRWLFWTILTALLGGALAFAQRTPFTYGPIENSIVAALAGSVAFLGLVFSITDQHYRMRYDKSLGIVCRLEDLLGMAQQGIALMNDLKGFDSRNRLMAKVVPLLYFFPTTFALIALAFTIFVLPVPWPVVVFGIVGMALAIVLTALMFFGRISKPR